MADKIITIIRANMEIVGLTILLLEVDRTIMMLSKTQRIHIPENVLKDML